MNSTLLFSQIWIDQHIVEPRRILTRESKASICEDAVLTGESLVEGMRIPPSGKRYRILLLLQWRQVHWGGVAVHCWLLEGRVLRIKKLFYLQELVILLQVGWLLLSFALHRRLLVIASFSYVIKVVGLLLGRRLLVWDETLALGVDLRVGVGVLEHWYLLLKLIVLWEIKTNGMYLELRILGAVNHVEIAVLLTEGIR